MKLSVITTSYNKCETLKHAIDSVINNLIGIDYELIIVDDGSTDGSVDIINSYTDSKIKKIFTPHYGMLNAYKVALDNVSGDYITFCDCDDYKNRGLKFQFLMMAAFNHDLTCSRAYIDNGKIIKSDTPIEVLEAGLAYDNVLKGKACVHAQTLMIKKDYFDKYIDFDKFLDFNVWDLPILLEAIRHTKMVYFDFYTGTYRVGTETATKTESRLKRLKLVLGYMKIKLWYIRRYGCKPTTFTYMIYKFTRDMVSIIFKRWNK